MLLVIAMVVVTKKYQVTKGDADLARDIDKTIEKMREGLSKIFNDT
ncbi:hypothetical protein [Pyrococcus abyssi]|nr:hypothetical protein [Pyrococcus abyssi]